MIQTQEIINMMLASMGKVNDSLTQFVNDPRATTVMDEMGQHMDLFDFLLISDH